MAHLSHRRDFLKTTAALGIGVWIAPEIRAESHSPNQRIAFAAIGVGGQGSRDSADAAKHGDIVAICDVDERHLAGAKKRKRFNKAKVYTDFRKMFEEFGNHIDAVTISTPDHVHAAATLMAMRMGKPCYCQKPLTRSIYEARLMAQVARDQKVATQMGNQGTALSSLRRAVSVLQSGVLGAAKEVHVWTDRPRWPQGGPRPQPAPCPSTLKWDEWIGPAPMRPFAFGYHPRSWRGWWDFGTGALGDMACHTMNMPYWALDLRNPISVQAETSGHNKDSYPKWSVIHYEFAATDKRPGVKFFWYDGGKLPDSDLFHGHVPPRSGSIVICEKGSLYAPYDYSGENPLIFGDEAPQVEWDKVAFEESPGHFAEWVRAIRGGPPAKSNFPDYAGALTETVLLGNLAVWVAAKGEGEKVMWDAKNMECTNISGLEPIIKPTYRSGYTLDV